MLEIVRFDPTPCGYPKPRIPVLPKRLQPEVFNGESAGEKLNNLSPEREPGSGSLAFPDSAVRPNGGQPIRNFRSFARGRYALGTAYQLAGLNDRTTLLAPSYHCLTMLDPAIHLGAAIQLYPLNPDLSPNLEQLDALLGKCTLPVKVLVAVHFFGIRQDLTLLQRWYQQRGIVLIEDCSHTLFTEGYQAPGIGRLGNFVVSSPYKFFACEDGGLLHASDGLHLQALRTHVPSIKDELRAAKRTLEHHSAALGDVPDDLDSQLSALLSAPKTPAQTVRYSYTKPSGAFSPNLIYRSASRVSRWLVRRSSPDSVARKRRANFSRWLDATRELPHCRPLYSRLPDDCVPYMFPLYIDHPEPHFDLLKRLGFPVWRWDEMAVSACPVATDYRLRLLHLPCHQSLTETQMDWLLAAIGKVKQTPKLGEP